MAKRMKLWVVGLLLLAAVGTVVGSNMGFKFVPNVATGSQIYTISIPLNHNYTNAQSLAADMQASGCTPNLIARSSATASGNPPTNWDPVGGGSAGQNFTIAKGQGYRIRTSSPCTNWVVVGSHDPAFQYSFATANVVYLTSIPYHTTAANAQDLASTIPSCTLVSRMSVTASGAPPTNWDPVGGGSAGQNFPVVIGQAYHIRVGTPNTLWTPAHY